MKNYFWMSDDNSAIFSQLIISAQQIVLKEHLLSDLLLLASHVLTIAYSVVLMEVASTVVFSLTTEWCQILTPFAVSLFQDTMSYWLQSAWNARHHVWCVLPTLYAFLVSQVMCYSPIYFVPKPALLDSMQIILLFLASTVLMTATPVLIKGIV